MVPNERVSRYVFGPKASKFMDADLGEDPVQSQEKAPATIFHPPFFVDYNTHLSSSGKSHSSSDGVNSRSECHRINL